MLRSLFSAAEGCARQNLILSIIASSRETGRLGANTADYKMHHSLAGGTSRAAIMKTFRMTGLSPGSYPAVGAAIGTRLPCASNGSS